MEPDVGEDVHARDGEPEGGDVACRAGAGGRERDDGQELDRGDGPERQAIDRDVEAAVHDGEDDAERDHEPPRLRVRPPERAPRAAPHREHRGGVAMRSQATPSGSTRANRRTAKAGPR